MQSAPLDLEAITARQQATWARGDFNVIALGVVSASEALIQSVDPHAGARVLDVACGSGNASLVAARRHCEVSGIDYVPALIERAKQRAAAEGTAIDFKVADAQVLPFADATFDAVVSVFGVMFAPDQPKAASELLRVCRRLLPGAREARSASRRPHAADPLGNHRRCRAALWRRGELSLREAHRPAVLS